MQLGVSKRTLTLATVALIGLAVAVAFSLVFLTPDSVPSSSDLPGARHEVLLPEVGEQSGNREYPSQFLATATADIPEQIPASLEGTNVPSGWDRTDATGSLVPTPELRQLFEHYLAALGEETLAQLVARIRRTLSSLDEPARSEAIEVLGSYLDYKLELGELEQASGDVASLDPNAMAQQLARIRSLRRQWLDADTAAAFFAAEEAVDEFQLAQMRIRADETLSDEARATQLQEAEQALPAPIREARQQTRKFSDYQQVRQELSDDPAALQAWRRNAFGEEAARRLAQVEAEQKAWDETWEAYQQEKTELERLGLAGPEQEAALSRLRDQFFDGPDRYRAEALDSIQ